MWRMLISEAWGDARGEGLDGGPVPELVVTGAAAPAPSRLPVAETAIACAGAALLGVAEFARLRGYRIAGDVRLDQGQLAAACRSERYLRVNGQSFGTGFAPLSGFWRTRPDPAGTGPGWVRTHANYPWHRDALLTVLGLAGASGQEAAEAGPDLVRAALAERDARELEGAVLAAGGIAVAMRTGDQWRREEQARLLARLPLIGGGRTADAPARDPGRVTEGALPLAGLRVLDLTRVIAGPVCTRFLAAFGAEVLRIDSPRRPELPLHTLDGLPGKRSALLDLASPAGLARLHELLDEADVLVHGYRPHALDRFGLSPADLAGRHPGLVTVSLSAWGDTGPWGERRGFDSIVQAASGIAALEGAGTGEPGRLPFQLLDHGTGYLAAAAVLRSVTAQRAGGGSHARSLSLARTAMWLLGQAPNPASTEPASTEPASTEPDPGWLCRMESARGPVTMVAPPGTLGAIRPRWPSRLTGYGTDTAAWTVSS